jgi:hypothetical protein
MERRPCVQPKPPFTYIAVSYNLRQAKNEERRELFNPQLSNWLICFYLAQCSIICG